MKNNGNLVLSNNSFGSKLFATVFFLLSCVVMFYNSEASVNNMLFNVGANFSVNANNNEIDSASGKASNDNLFGLVSEVSNGFAGVVKEILPSVVNITARQKCCSGQNNKMTNPFYHFKDLRDFLDKMQPFFDAPMQPERDSLVLGSGFIVDDNGHILTNNHVIDQADDITVSFNDGTTAKAKLVGKDILSDVALIKVDKKNIKGGYVKIGDSDRLKIGEWAIAVGNPFGLGNSVSVGIISARSRDIDIGSLGDFIQTDAPINKGNSGGPLFNLKGEVIGMNTAIYSTSGGSIGIGFAVPANVFAPVMEQLKKFGKVDRGYIGVKIMAVDDEVSKSVKLESPAGALVVDVAKDSPAEKSDIKAGDIILYFDGKKVASVKTLPKIVISSKVGSTVPVIVWRNGKKYNLEVKIGRLESSDITSKNKRGDNDDKDFKEDYIYDKLGFAITNLDHSDKKDDSDVEEGVVVEYVKRGGESEIKGLKEGDVITQLNQHDIKDVANFKEELRKLIRDKREYVLLLVVRSPDIRFFLTLSLKDK